MGPIRFIRTTYREAFAGLPAEVWLLSATALINRAGTMVLPFFALFLTRDRGFGVAEAGGFVALYGAGSVVGSFLGGWLSDRIGSIRTQQVSLLGAGIGFLSIPFLREPSSLGVGIFLTSAVAEAFRPAVMTAVAHRSPPGLQARSFALLRLAVNMGMAIGPTLGGLLAAYSYRWLFFVDALTAWAAAILIGLWLSPRRAGRAERRAAAADGARSPWQDGPFLMLTGIVTLLALCVFQIFGTMPIYLREIYGLGERSIGGMFGLNAAMIVTFEMVIIHHLEGRNRLVWIGIGTLAMCGGLALLPLGRSLSWAVLVTAIWTVGEMLILPLTNAAVADRAAPSVRGRYMGLYTMSFSMAFILAPLGGTWLYANRGPDSVWIVIGVLGIPLCLACLALSRSYRSAVASSA